MELQRETLCQDTRYMLEQYYQHKPGALFSALSEDCVWLNVGNLVVSGKDAIKSCFSNGFVMPVYTMDEVTFSLIESGSKNYLTVLGQYFLSPSKNADMLSAARQRITCCYRNTGDGFRIYHLHVSNQWDELAEDEIYPFRMSRQTYQYVQNLLEQKGAPISPRLIFRQNKTAYFIDTGRLIYAEAMRKHTILHMVGETKEIPVSFHDILKELPSQFYRLHRSYAVNCDYAESLDRYMLTLITKEQIPVPQLRYNEIYSEITEIIKRNEGRT